MHKKLISRQRMKLVKDYVYARHSIQEDFVSYLVIFLCSSPSFFCVNAVLTGTVTAAPWHWRNPFNVDGKRPDRRNTENHK